MGIDGLLGKQARDRTQSATLHFAGSRFKTALRNHGLLIKAPSGYPIVNPYLSIANKAMLQIRAFLTEFGMTPSSRSRISAQPPNEEDEFEKFMRTSER